MNLSGFAHRVPSTGRLSPAETPILANPVQINAKLTGATALYVVPAGFGLVVNSVRFVQDEADTVTVPPEISVGTSGDYDQLMQLTPFDAAEGETQLHMITGVVPSLGAGTTIYANVGVAATATTCNVSVFIEGSLYPNS